MARTNLACTIVLALSAFGVSPATASDEATADANADVTAELIAELAPALDVVEVTQGPSGDFVAHSDTVSVSIPESGSGDVVSAPEDGGMPL